MRKTGLAVGAHLEKVNLHGAYLEKAHLVARLEAGNPAVPT